MPYAFLNPDGSIKQVFAKPSPFMRLAEGERMVNYNPPAYDPEVERVEPVLPMAETELDMQFTVTPLDKAMVDKVWLRRYSALVQAHLDAAAQARGYDNMLSAVSYAGSGHPTFGPEGAAFRDWRDACWVAMFAWLDGFKGGNHLPMDEQALLSVLPTLNLAGAETV